MITLRTGIAIAVIGLGGAAAAAAAAAIAATPATTTRVYPPAPARRDAPMPIAAIDDLLLEVPLLELEPSPEGAAVVGGGALARSAEYIEPRIFKPP